METGVLRATFNGMREELMNTIDLAPTVTFQMETCNIYFGGIPPVFEGDAVVLDLEFSNFLGNMRGITVSNPGSNSILNPLYSHRHKHNPFFGIEPNCERKVGASLAFPVIFVKI